MRADDLPPLPEMPQEPDLHNDALQQNVKPQSQEPVSVRADDLPPLPEMPQEPNLNNDALQQPSGTAPEEDEMLSEAADAGELRIAMMRLPSSITDPHPPAW